MSNSCDAVELKCDVCEGQSGGKYAGVACIPGHPCSIAWCVSCLTQNAFPQFIFDYEFIVMSKCKRNVLADWAQKRVTWFQNKYISYNDYTTEMSKERIKELKEYYKK